MSRLVWQKSSFSGTDGTQDCIEVAVSDDGLVRFRESDDPGTVAVTTPAKWATFVKGIKAGEFDHFAAPAAAARRTSRRMSAPNTRAAVTAASRSPVK